MSQTARPESLHALLELAWACFDAAPVRPPGAVQVAERIATALQRSGDCSRPPPPLRLPACQHLEGALDAARRAPGHVPALAQAFASLSPVLSWSRRPGSAAGPFFDGHANALLVGPRGLERRGDVMVGASLVAPAVRYPEHRHPPEEIYVVLTPGEWRNEDTPWHQPGPGGVVHNPPGIVHAMRAGSVPLLALWFLWTGDNGFDTSSTLSQGC
jgi:quercetin dioxygenase-like cupin family protein